MKYSELKAKATPRPWVALHGLAVDNPQIGRILVACDAPNTNSTPAEKKDADMRLTAHCVNNFDRALAMLKLIAGIYEDVDTEPMYQCRELIAELEDVKT